MGTISIATKKQRHTSASCIDGSSSARRLPQDKGTLFSATKTQTMPPHASASCAMTVHLPGNSIMEHCLSVSTATHIYVPGNNYRCVEHYLPPTTHTSLINTVWMTVHLPLISATCQGNTAYQHQHTYVWMTGHLPGDTQTYATQGAHAGMHTECNASKLQNSGNPPPSPCPPPPPQSQISRYYFMIS